MLEKWQILTIGVADLERAVHLWVDIIGYEIVASRTGQDDQLAKQWDWHRTCLNIHAHKKVLRF